RCLELPASVQAARPRPLCAHEPPAPPASTLRSTAAPNSPVRRPADATAKVDGVTRSCPPITGLLRSVIASAEGAWRYRAVRPQSGPAASLGTLSAPRALRW